MSKYIMSEVSHFYLLIITMMQISDKIVKKIKYRKIKINNLKITI